MASSKEFMQYVCDQISDVGFLYPGSKEHFILDTDNLAFTNFVFGTLQPRLSVHVKS